jgi:murein tripeptide amidase MpaA
MNRNIQPSHRRLVDLTSSFLQTGGLLSWLCLTFACSWLLLRFFDKPAAALHDGYASAIDPNPPVLWPWLKWLDVTPTHAPDRKFVGASLFGLRPTRSENSASALSAYPHLNALERRFADLALAYPHLARLEKIGESTGWRLPIWGIRISDYPERDEDEPAVLFTGVHHAREPLGALICEAILEELLAHYGKSERHTRLVDSLEIWLVPVVNPDGYDYIMRNQLQFPWWRKNLRDNNGDGVFDPLVDGVDLNRNYDFNWEEGGDGNPASWFYRGSSPFSEREIQALRDLAWRENFLVGVSYHSYGESVLYPWGNYHRPPDQELIFDIAQRCAEKIDRLSGNGGYNVLPLNGRVGQSSVWMYGELGAMDYIIETGENYFAAPEDIPRIARENVKGALFLLERSLGSGVNGHVRDRLTGKPIAAEIHANGCEASYVKCRRSDSFHGRFDRLLFPGNYTIEIRAPGYKTEVLAGVPVRQNAMTPLEITLARQPSSLLPSAH